MVALTSLQAIAFLLVGVGVIWAAFRVKGLIHGAIAAIKKRRQEKERKRLADARTACSALLPLWCRPQTIAGELGWSQKDELTTLVITHMNLSSLPREIQHRLQQLRNAISAIVAPSVLEVTRSLEPLGFVIQGARVVMRWPNRTDNQSHKNGAGGVAQEAHQILDEVRAVGENVRRIIESGSLSIIRGDDLHPHEITAKCVEQLMAPKESVRRFLTPRPMPIPGLAHERDEAIRLTLEISRRTHPEGWGTKLGRVMPDT